MLFKKIPEKYALSEDFKAATDLAVTEPTDDASWWMPDIKRKELKDLMRRQDRIPLINYLLWLALLGATGYLAFLSLGSWWAVPAFLLYGTIYSSSDPRSHDLGHGATFKTGWLNTAFCNLCLFMTLKEPIDWRWRHARHHTDTIHVGLDPEILVTRPADLMRIAADFFFIMQAKGELKNIFLHTLGIPSADSRHYVPRSEWNKMFWSARFYTACMVAVIALCVVTSSIVPLLFIWGPRVYANWLNYFGFLSQHAGLAEDSKDHRLNTRTFTMNKPFEFLYANLNYHIEHHIYPSIPYYNLPVLHKRIKEQLPYTYTGLFDISREVLPALWRQAHYVGYFMKRQVPAAYPSTPNGPAVASAE